MIENSAPCEAQVEQYLEHDAIPASGPGKQVRLRPSSKTGQGKVNAMTWRSAPVAHLHVRGAHSSFIVCFRLCGVQYRRNLAGPNRTARRCATRGVQVSMQRSHQTNTHHALIEPNGSSAMIARRDPSCDALGLHHWHMRIEGMCIAERALIRMAA